MPKKMIYIDDSDPVGTLEPSFPSRDVTIKRNVDAKDLYELISEIGRGKFGTVYKCREKSTSLELAAKFVPIPKREDRRNVEREVEIMNSLQHPLIIQLYAAYEYQKMMCVVLELIEGGELFDRVVDDDFVLTERVCAVFMRQVCEAMQFIHRNNILHLDLKPENILCITKEGNRIKIIDFGLARKYDPDKKLQVLFGTPEFVAPEVVNFDTISYSTDMWSVGVICYVLLSGLSPFMGETDIETMANVTIAKYDFDDEAFNNVSQEALDFISKLLIKDMSSRMTASECLEHKWLERRPKSAPPSSQTNQPQTITKQTPVSIQQQQLPPKCTKTPPTPPPSSTPEQPPLLPQTTPATPAAASLKGPKTTSTVDTTPTTTDITKPPRPTTQQESTQKEESLEQAKDNLKTFIERWEEHPNSPYVFDTGSNLISPIHPGSNSTKGSSNVSSGACSPSPCGSIYSTSEDNNNFDNSNIKDEKMLIKNTETSKINDNNLENTTNIKEYLHSFDRRNSDTNYVLGRHSSSEKINLAEEIRKLSDHLLMLAEINTKLGKENNNEDLKQHQQRKISTTDKLETIQESTGRITPTPTKESTNISELLKPQVKTTFKKSTSVIESPSSKDNISTTKKKSTTTTTKSKKISSLSFRLQQSFDETPHLISNGDDIEQQQQEQQQQQDTGYKFKNQNIEERAAKLINGFKQQLISQNSTTSSLPSSPSSTTTTTTSNLASSVPWTVTNKRTKFRINQMSRDVPIGSPDTHQPIDLEDAANTTKDCLLHLLEKYNERKWRNGPIGRHQSISVDWNVSENLEYQSMSSINAFFRKHSTKGNYVKQLQAQLEAKSKK